MVRPCSKIELVVLDRRQLPEDLVSEDYGNHICASHEHTHRSLATGTEADRERFYKHARGQFEGQDSGRNLTKRYTREMLADLLEFLVGEEKIKAEYQEVAGEILDQLIGS
jgi:hypothetical protein